MKTLTVERVGFSNESRASYIFVNLVPNIKKYIENIKDVSIFINKRTISPV